MSISKIQTGDNVKVLSGKYRGHTGKVTAVRKKTDERGRLKIRASVSGVETIAKYRKANRTYNTPGAQNQVDRFMDISNISLIDEKGSVSKVKIDEKEGKKFRVYKTTGTKVTKESVALEAVAPTEAAETKSKAKKKAVTKKKDI
jgi:large subunit ribosomal protein L24